MDNIYIMSAIGSLIMAVGIYTGFSVGVIIQIRLY